jgi:hypothetical protein
MVVVVMGKFLLLSWGNVMVAPAGLAAVAPSRRIALGAPEVTVIPVVIAVMVAVVVAMMSAERVAVMIPVVVPIAVVIPVVIAMFNPVFALVLVMPVVLCQRRARAQRQPQKCYQSHPKCLFHDPLPSLANAF